MSLNLGMYTSDQTEWETPQLLFDAYNDIYNFTIDVCAQPFNTKVDRYYTPEDDGLSQSWSGEVVWMNPPYGTEVPKWTLKAAKERKRAIAIVALLPARTDTAWWHDNVAPYSELHFLRGRLSFDNTRGTAPFPSVIAIYGRDVVPGTVKWVQWK